MTEDTWVNVLALCDQVENLLTDAKPIADPQRLQRIESACNRMCGRDTYITEKANKIARRAAIYLSARKHTTEVRGANGVMQEMRHHLLTAIREQAEFLGRGLK